MKIEIESRKSIKIRAKEPFPAHTAIISITDMDNDFVVLKNKPEYFLRLKFDDVTHEMLEDYYSGCESPASDGIKTLAEKHHIFNDKQAEKVSEFVKSILNKAELLICQCEFGQSRSAGLAAAVRQFLHGDGVEIFADDRYYPNKVVFRKVFAALKNEKNQF